MIDRLVEILEEEILLYKEFLSLLQEEKRLLCRRVIDELHDLSGKIETLAFKIKGMEGLRDRIVEELIRLYGLVPTDVRTLSMIIGAVEEPYKGRLKGLQSSLLALIEGIKELNQENSIVIGRGMENIKTAFMFLKEFSTIETYHSSGKMNAAL